MIQDKEELIHKRVKSEGGDKEGLKEAELRRKLTSIMSAYGLLHHFDPDAAKEKDHPVSNVRKITFVIVMLFARTFDSTAYLSDIYMNPGYL